MAFFCILTEGQAQGQFFFSPSSNSVLIPVGYDDDPDTDKSYNLFVSFDPLTGTDDLEFSFAIIEHDSETDSEYVYWSGREIAQFITREDRNVIGGTLLAASERLLNAKRPSRFIMCTRDDGAPQRAHQKFIRIAHLFAECGYVVTNADPYHGLQIWWMERTDPPAD